MNNDPEFKLVEFDQFKNHMIINRCRQSIPALGFPINEPRLTADGAKHTQWIIYLKKTLTGECKFSCQLECGMGFWKGTSFKELYVKK